MKHPPAKDEVILWKSANVGLPDGRHMLCLYYYHTDKEDRSKSFYQCNIRIETEENWRKLALILRKDEPADILRTPMLGLPGGDYRIYYTRPLTKINFSRWLEKKFKKDKSITLAEFLTPRGSVNCDFLRKYDVNGELTDVTEYEKIPSGKWFHALRKIEKKGTYGRVIF